MNRSLLAAAVAASAFLLSGCLTAIAPERARGQGSRQTYNATPDEAREGIHKIFEKFGPDYAVTDEGDMVVAQYDKMTSGVHVVIRYKGFISPSAASGQTDVEFLAEMKYAGPEIMRKTENNFLASLADAIELVQRRKGGGAAVAAASAAPAPAPSSSVPSPAPAAARAASDVDRFGRKAKSPRPDDYALVVGIEQYQRVPKADYAERDARTMKEYLQGLGVPEENVILLTGAEATRTGLAKYLEEWLPRNVAPDSRVYIYYSGHGAPDPKDGSAYLLPWDGDASFLKSSAYPVARLYESLGALKAKEVVVMLDSCFSGAGGRSVIAAGARPLVTVKDTAGAGPKLTVLAASSGDEITGSLDDQGHGMFTYYLLKGLQGAADPSGSGRVTVGDLHAFVKKSVERAAHRQNREQTPQLKTSRTDLTLY
ncbi:MAG: caspase family protein [Elusimicrobia bacterium]|nr:caspase family protein [Elusimicrobiota bacterium]